MAFGWEHSLNARWSRLERAYIWLFGVVDLPTRLRARSVRSVTSTLGRGRIVDFGAGTGVYAFFYSRERDRSVVAVDVDASRVSEIDRIANALGRGRLKTICSDGAFFTRYSGDQVDLVLAIEVLQCCPNVENLFRDLFACLSPGGALVAYIPLRQELRPYELHLFTEQALIDLAHSAGFAEVTVRPTFGRGSRRLCAAFEALSRHHILLALAFPFLLLGTMLIPRFSNDGEARVLVARKSQEVAHSSD